MFEMTFWKNADFYFKNSEFESAFGLGLIKAWQHWKRFRKKKKKKHIGTVSEKRNRQIQEYGQGGY